MDEGTVMDSRGAGLSIAVVGGGNAAHALAADLQRLGHSIRMLEYPGRKSRLAAVCERGSIRILGCGRDHEAKIERVTTDPAEALDGADVVFVAVPAYAHRPFAELTVPHLGKDQLMVLFTGGLGGLEWIVAARRRGLVPDFKFVETHTLPYAARVTGEAEVTIHHDVCHVVGGVFPAVHTAEVAEILSPLYPQIEYRRDILESALCNMNGVIHPPVMVLNVSRIERARGQPWWIWECGVTPSVAALVERLDEERLALGRAYGLELECVADLQWRSGYGPRGTIYESLNGSAVLRNIQGPTTVHDRFMTEDVAFFLRTFVDLAEAAGLRCPVMRAVTEVACGIAGVDFWSSGRTMESLELGGMNPRDVCAYLAEGVQQVGGSVTDQSSMVRGA